jgi:hypothetical protein
MAELQRGASGSRFTGGVQTFNVKLAGFKTGMSILHQVPIDIKAYFNRDTARLAQRILKYALENLMSKVYDPAGVDPHTGGYHQKKGYWVTGNLYRSGRWGVVSASEANAATAYEAESEA